ncbi:MAG: 4-(cytidine 5'-diphospho)-2-C-methyl-D-erythritol kinase [Thermoguttaceae bacterium]|jgi:4-diphosphocytidyl-2-C-methyl-D-erythritol kinase
MSSSRITLRAPAKLNLFFEILGRRVDGYHEVVTITAPISLCDEVQIELLPGSGECITLTCVDEFGRDLSASVPNDEGNLAVKAARAISETSGASPSLRIRLLKRIPTEAGLGGGSSDAAAVLVGLNRLLALNYTQKRLAEIGARLGSDVPLFFEKGFALGKGRGEQTEPLPSGIAPLTTVLIKPPIGLSTAEVYQAVPQAGTEMRHSPELLISALLRGNVDEIRPLLFNRLEKTARTILPCLDEIFTHLLPYGDFRLTGSGTALYALVRDAEEGTVLKDRIERGGIPGTVFVCSTIPSPLSPSVDCGILAG